MANNKPIDDEWEVVDQKTESSDEWETVDVKKKVGTPASKTSSDQELQLKSPGQESTSKSQKTSGFRTIAEKRGYKQKFQYEETPTEIPTMYMDEELAEKELEKRTDPQAIAIKRTKAVKKLEEAEAIAEEARKPILEKIGGKKRTVLEFVKDFGIKPGELEHLQNPQQILSTEDQEEYLGIVDFKRYTQKKTDEYLNRPEDSYFWGVIGGINKATARTLRTMDGAARLLNDLMPFISSSGSFGEAADYIEEMVATSPKQAPKNIGGMVAEGFGSLLEELPLMVLAPETRLSYMGKVRKIPGIVSYMATTNALRTYEELDKTGAPDWEKIKDTGIAFGEGAAEGYLMEAFGFVSGKTGRLVKGITDSNIAGKVASSVTNGTLFGGMTATEQYLSGKVNPQEVISSAILGAGLDLVAGKSLKENLESVQKKATDRFFTTSVDDIVKINDLPITVDKLREWQIEVQERANKETDLERKEQLQIASQTLDGYVDIKAVNKQILTDPASIIKSIKDDPKLSDTEKDYYVNKINEVVAKTDPRLQAIKPLTDEIDRIDNNIGVTRDNTSIPDNVKQHVIEGLEKRKEDLAKDINNEMSKPVNVVELNKLEQSKSKDYERKNERSYGRKRSTSTDETKIESREGSEPSEEGPKVKDEGKGKELLKPEEHATEKGKVEEGSVPEHKRVPQGKDLRKDEEKVRQEKGEQTGRGRSPERKKEISEEKEIIPEFVPEGMAEPEPTGAKTGTVEIGKKEKTSEVKSGEAEKLPDETYQMFPVEKARIEAGDQKLRQEFNSIKYKEKILDEKLDFDKEGDLTDNAFSRVEFFLKNTVREVSGKFNIPSDILFKHYNINDKGEYFSSLKPILEVGKSLNFKDLINTTKKILHKLYPDRIDELNEAINSHKQDLLNALERGDSNFKINEGFGKSIGKVYSALIEINNKFNDAIGYSETKSETTGVEFKVEKKIPPKKTRKTEPKIGSTVGYKDHVNTDRVGEILSIESDGKYRVKSKEGVINKVSPEKIESVTEAEKAIKEGTQVVEPTIKEKAKVIADKIRTGKIDKDILTVGVPFAKEVWNGAVEVAAKTVEAGGDIAQAVKDAIDHIKGTDWYKGLDFDKKQEIEKKFNSHLDELLGPEPRQEIKAGLKDQYSKIEKEVFGTITKESADIKARSIVDKILGSPQLLQEATTAKAAEYLGKGTASIISKGITSTNKPLRIISKGLKSIFANLSKTTEEVQRSEQFVGEGFERSISDANEINKRLREIISNDKESLKKIDQVIDPEFYKKLSKEEFYDELEQEFGTKKFNSFSKEDIDAKYEEYLRDMKFDDPNYKVATYEDLTPQEQKVADIVRSIYNYVHDVNFAIGKLDYPTYLKNIGIYSARMYDVHEIPADVAEVVSTTYKKMELGLYKKREDLDSWKRAHKIEDPIYSMSKRLYQTMLNKSIVDYGDWITTHHPELVSEIESKGFTKMGNGYGELSNKYVRDDIVEDFRGVFFTNDVMNKFYDLLKSYNRFAPRQFYKKLFTIYNPGVHVGNLTGNIVFAQLQGINPIRFIGDMVWAKKEVSDYGPTYRYLMSKGLLKTDLTREDLSQSLTRLNNEFDNASKQKNPFKYLSKLNKKITDIYRGTDDLAKVAAFKSLTDMGISPDIAINKVANGFQNYQRVGKAYDVTTKLPVIGQPFGKFQGDIVRIIRTGVVRTPLNYAATVGTLFGIAYMAQVLSGETDKDRKIREGRPGFPKIPFPAFLGGDIPLSFKMGSNEINMARFISPLYIYSTPDGDDTYNLFSKLSPLPMESVDKTVNPEGKAAVLIAKNANDPVFAPLIQLAFNSDFRGMPITDPKETYYKSSLLTPKEKAVNGLRFLARNYVPYGTYGDDFMDAMKGEEDYYGRNRTPSQIVLRFLGYNAQLFDDTKYNTILEKAIQAKSFDFVNNSKNIDRLQREFIDKKITKDQYENRLAVLIENQSKLLSDIKSKIDVAMPRMSMKDINKILEPTGFGKYNRVVNNQQYNNIILRLQANKRNMDDIYDKSGSDAMSKYIQDNNLGEDVNFYKENKSEIFELERVIDYLGSENITEYDADVQENMDNLVNAYNNKSRVRLTREIKKLYREYEKKQKTEKREKQSVIKEFR